MKIPLSNFVDRTDARYPKGRINSDFSLGSPMRDILANYHTQKVVDLRPRDYPHSFQYGPTFNPGMYDLHAGRRFVFSNGNYNDELILDDDGLRSGNTSGYTFRPAQFDYADVPNGVTLFNAGAESRGIMIWACKIRSLSQPGFVGTSGLIDTTAGGALRFGHYIAYISAAYTYRRQNDAVLKTFGASDADAWHLFAAVKDGTTLTHRWLGGATSVLGSNAAGPSYSGNSNQIQIPIGTHFTLGLWQLALWTGNNDAGAAGTAQGDIDYTLFDEWHVTGECAAIGNKVTYSSVGGATVQGFVNGEWINADGSTGIGDVFSEDADGEELRFPALYTKLRCVLNNAGILNAASRAAITCVSSDSEASLGAIASAPAGAAGARASAYFTRRRSRRID